MIIPEIAKIGMPNTSGGFVKADKQRRLNKRGGEQVWPSFGFMEPGELRKPEEADRTSVMTR